MYFTLILQIALIPTKIASIAATMVVFISFVWICCILDFSNSPSIPFTF